MRNAFCYLTLYKLRDSFFVMRSPCTTLLREVRLRFGSKNESFCTFILYFAHLALTFLRQVRLRFGMTDKKTRFFLCHALTLH